jgi:hypothetical protein
VPHRIISVIKIKALQQLWGELDNTTLDGIPPNGTEGILGVDLGGTAGDLVGDKGVERSGHDLVNRARAVSEPDTVLAARGQPLSNVTFQLQQLTPTGKTAQRLANTNGPKVVDGAIVRVALSRFIERNALNRD